MTVAICLKCGEFKHGAYTQCQACKYIPEDDESLTKHLLVSDHFMSREQQEEIIKDVKAGNEIKFDPETLKQMRVSKASLDRSTMITKFGCFLILIAVVIWAVSRLV